VTEWSWGHMDDGTHVVRSLELNPYVYYLRPVYEAAIGIEWELWQSYGQFTKIGQWSTFKEAVQEMERDYETASMALPCGDPVSI
jgi:hypothetical protein